MAEPELSKEEIRSACEAILWEWDEGDPLTGWCAWTPERKEHPHPLFDEDERPHTWNADAGAMLVAWSSLDVHVGPAWFKVTYSEVNDWEHVVTLSVGCVTVGRGEGPDLPTASVRAVNDWQRRRATS